MNSSQNASPLSVLVDPSALTALRSISPTDPDEFIRTLVKLFITQTESDLQVLKEAQSQAEVKRIGQIAHKLGSAAKQLGAFRLGNRAHELEKVVKQNGDFASITELADQIFLDFAETKTYFETRI